MKPLEILGAIAFFALIAALIFFAATATGQRTPTSQELDQQEAFEQQRAEARARDEQRATVNERSGEEQRSDADQQTHDERMRACRASAQCEVAGRCVYVEPMLGVGLTDFSLNDCRAAIAGDCERSRACVQFGLCSLEPAIAACYIQSDYDCTKSTICKEHGFCSRALAVEVRGSEMREPFGRTCAAMKDEDCAAGSYPVKERRLCADDGECVRCPRR